MYSSWGISALETARVVVFCGLTLLIGFFTLAGVLFLVEPMPIPSVPHLPLRWVHPVAVLFLALVAVYVLLTALRRRPLKLRQWELPLPPVGLSLLQIGLSCLDWVLAGSVLYVLLPVGAPLPFLKFMAAFLLAEIAGLVSQVPGGLGVLESMSLLLLSPPLPASTVLAALLLYRAIYYLFPFVVGVVVLSVHEIVQGKTVFGRIASALGQWASFLVPRALSVSTFLAGAILLFSGALPTPKGRMAWLDRFLPLTAIEVSHFLGSLVGAGLLILAWGLRRRLSAAYLLSSILLAAGIVFSLTKGLHYEEAIVLAMMLAVLIPCRRHFYRKAPLLSGRFSRACVATVAAVLLCSIGLGLFAYKHVEYSNELWWRFSLLGHAPRFLRASVGVFSVVLLFGLAKLLRPVAPRPSAPGPVEWEKARAIVVKSRQTSANLALTGDKVFLFSASGSAFIMYAVQGRSWIALGDPVGPEKEWRELVWQFRELCDGYDGWTVFYEVGEENVGLYLDIGLTLLKLGEEARVPLEGFSLEDPSRKSLRQSHRRIMREGCTLELVPAMAVPFLLGKLKEISDAWLASKNTRERGFSLGYFDEEYLRNFPAAVIRRKGDLLGFANVWLGAEKEELSIDLMRYLPDSAPGVMDYLLVELMLWGREEGYKWFNLGMAPLSGFESGPIAPVWNRLATFTFRHGEHFHNFQGLRQYKEKFHPVWSPRFLASPGGLALPRVLGNLGALISRGSGGILRK